MQMNYSYASDLSFKNFCKLAKRAETIKNRFWLCLSIVRQTHKLTRYQSKKFSYRTFLYKTNTKVSSRRAAFIHSLNHSAKLKKFSTLKNTPFPLNQSINVHIRAMVLLCLIPCHRCEKSERESRNSHHFITYNVTTSTREPTTRAWISVDI